MIKINNPCFDNASYIDPRARVFSFNGQICRAFFPEVSAFYRQLINSEKMVSIINQGKVVETEILQDMEVLGFDLVVKHRKIENPNYYFEWSKNMLKDAALLTLDLCIDYCDDNITLHDATPYNIFFDSTKPLFIDLASFGPQAPGYLWNAYQQFCNLFLFPLYLFSCGDFELTTKLLKNCDQGISADNVTRIISFFEKLKIPGYFSRIFFPKALSKLVKVPSNQKKTRDFLSHLMDMNETKRLTRMRKAFFTSLKKDVLNINFSEKDKSTWTNYYTQTDKVILSRKKTLVESITKQLNPKTLLDIGCNKGEFSILAAESGVKVISFDVDHNCVDSLYKEAKNKNLNILPLVMNILSPTPQTGWRNVQYKSAQERLRSDMVYAFALIHHLVFSGGQDFIRIIQSIKDFCSKWLIIEFISIKDSQVEMLSRRPHIDYSWYNQHNFSKVLSEYFSEVTVVERISDTRTIFLAKV